VLKLAAAAALYQLVVRRTDAH